MLLDKPIPLSYVLKKIKVELISVLIIGLMASYVSYKLEDQIPVMPLSIPAFLGTAISVILSFKLNQSYDRWWEARKIWGSIVNDSRNLVLQLQSFAGDRHEDIHKIAHRQIAWCYSLGQSLRGQDALALLENRITREEIEKVSRHNNKPLAILQLNSEHLAKLRQNNALDPFNHVQLNNTMVNLTNYMGMAERIKSTVFPATYKLFLHLFIYLFVVTLSVALNETSIYFEVPLLLLISAVFFLLERTATHLQDPFSNKPTDTAMTAIATTIEINLKQLVGETDVPNPASTDKYYLM